MDLRKVGFTPPYRNGDCQSDVSFMNVGSIIMNVAILQAASNFFFGGGIGKSRTVGVCYRITGLWPETESAGVAPPISGMSHF